MVSTQRSTIIRLHSEVKKSTSLPVKENYNLLYSAGTPKWDLGVPGDWCIDTTTGNVFLKTVMSWRNIIRELENVRKSVTIYCSDKSTPDTPTEDINIGWSAEPPTREPVYSHIWQSTADYIGNARVTEWTTPTTYIRGSKVKRRPLEKPVKSVHFIYTASKKKPSLKRRVDDPTKGTRWTSDRSAFERSNIPVWQSRGVKDQDGNLIGVWTTPVKLSGDDGSEVDLSVDEAGTIMQKYTDESDTEKRPVATREEIIKEIKTDELQNKVITNAKLGEQAVREINVRNGEMRAHKLNLDIHLLT